MSLEKEVAVAFILQDPEHADPLLLRDVLEAVHSFQPPPHAPELSAAEANELLEYFREADAKVMLIPKKDRPQLLAKNPEIQNGNQWAEQTV